MDQLPRLGKRELICLLLFTCNYVVSVWRGFLFLWVLGMGYVILLWHSLSLPYNYFGVRGLVMFQLMSVCSYNFSSVWVAEWPSFGKKLLTWLTICCICIFTIRFGSEDGIWVLNAPCPGHYCILMSLIFQQTWCVLQQLYTMVHLV